MREIEGARRRGLRALLVVSVVALGGVAQAAPVNTPAAVPRNLHVYNTAGATYVDHVPADCSGYRYYIDPNHVKYDTIVAILLAAQASGTSVVLRFEGCTPENQGKVKGVYWQ
jgi:hypothetical protein